MNNKIDLLLKLLAYFKKRKNANVGKLIDQSFRNYSKSEVLAFLKVLKKYKFIDSSGPLYKPTTNIKWIW